MKNMLNTNEIPTHNVGDIVLLNTENVHKAFSAYKGRELVVKGVWLYGRNRIKYSCSDKLTGSVVSDPNYAGNNALLFSYSDLTILSSVGSTTEHNVGDDVMVSDDISDTNEISFLEKLKGKKLFITGKWNEDGIILYSCRDAEDGPAIRNDKSKPFPFIYVDLVPYVDADTKELKIPDTEMRHDIGSLVRLYKGNVVLKVVDGMYESSSDCYVYKVVQNDLISSELDVSFKVKEDEIIEYISPKFTVGATVAVSEDFAPKHGLTTDYSKVSYTVADVKYNEKRHMYLYQVVSDKPITGDYNTSIKEMPEEYLYHAIKNTETTITPEVAELRQAMADLFESIARDSNVTGGIKEEKVSNMCSGCCMESDDKNSDDVCGSIPLGFPDMFKVRGSVLGQALGLSDIKDVVKKEKNKLGELFSMVTPWGVMSVCGNEQTDSEAYKKEVLEFLLNISKAINPDNAEATKNDSERSIEEYVPFKETYYIELEMQEAVVGTIIDMLVDIRDMFMISYDGIRVNSVGIKAYKTDMKFSDIKKVYAKIGEEKAIKAHRMIVKQHLLAIKTIKEISKELPPKECSIYESENVSIDNIYKSITDKEIDDLLASEKPIGILYLATRY